jgi:hypothetical protein
MYDFYALLIYLAREQQARHVYLKDYARLLFVMRARKSTKMLKCSGNCARVTKAKVLCCCAQGGEKSQVRKSEHRTQKGSYCSEHNN